MPDSNYTADPVAMLGAFGLTRQEAAVYIGLLAEGEMNGYEAAKSLSISRSNAYTALAGLVEKGAAWTIEGKVTRFTPVPPEEVCANRIHHLDQLKKRLVVSLPERQRSQGAYMTIRGETHIFDRLRHMLNATEHRVYLALGGEVLFQFLDELEAILGRNGKVVIVSDPDTVQDLADRRGLEGAVVYTGHVAPEQIRVIVDSTHVLTGELTPGAPPSCLYSDQKHLADLFKTALRNEIRLIELGEALPREE